MLFNSVVSFLGFFLAVTLSLSFYGRNFLKLIKVKEKTYEGEALPLSVAFVLITAAAYLLEGLLSLRLLLFWIFYLGVLGFITELSLKAIRVFLKEKNKKEWLKEGLLKRDSLIASLIIALLFSIFYLAIFSSPKLSPWLGGNLDYNVWFFITDITLGNVDKTVFEFQGLSLNKLFYDCFGVYVTLGYLSAALGKSAFMSAAYCPIILATWLGVCLYSLVKSVLKSGFWPSLLLSLGVMGGFFFNYIVFMGFFGQLFGTAGFLTALSTALKNDIEDKGEDKREDKGKDKRENKGDGLREKTLKILFPLVMILFFYPGPLPVFYCFFYLTLLFYILPSFLAYKGPFFGGDSPVKKLYPGILAGILSLSLFPAESYFCYMRITQVATQTLGWALPNLSAFLFSGFPGYAWALIYPGKIGLTVSYSVLFILLGTLFALTLKRKREPEKDGNSPYEEERSGGTIGVRSVLLQNRELNAILLSYLTAMVIYLYAVAIIGNTYQVWKFSSYALSPLSFVPMAFLYKALTLRLGLSLKKILLASLVILILLSVLAFKYLTPLKTFPNRYYSIRNASEFYEILDEARDFIPENKTLAYQMSDNYKTVMVLNAFGMTKAKRIYSLEAARLDMVKRDYLKYLLNMPNVYTYSDFSRIMDKVDFIVSDARYEGLFNGAKSVNAGDVLYVYDRNFLNANGFVSFLGLASNSRETLGRYFRANITLPEALRGEKAEVTLSFTKNNYDPLKETETLCVTSGATAYILRNGEKIYIDGEVLANEIRAYLSKEETQKGSVTLETVLPESFGFPDGPCSITIGELSVREAPL
jgi:hypothetical protein